MIFCSKFLRFLPIPTLSRLVNCSRLHTPPHPYIGLTPFLSSRSTVPSWGARSVSVVEQEVQGKFVMKVGIEPFTEKDITFKVDQGAVRVVGKRGEQTGKSNWSHSMDMVLPLPSNIKQNTVQSKLEKGTIILTAEIA